VSSLSPLPETADTSRNGSPRRAAARRIDASRSGSACTSARLEPSHVMTAIGVPAGLAHASLRFGLGRWTTQEEVDFAVETTVNAVAGLRENSPLSKTVRS
jgi:cysteine desulfurase